LRGESKVTYARIATMLMIIIVMILLLAFARGINAQTEVPYENHKPNLPTVPPHPTNSTSPLLKPTNSPFTTEKSTVTPHPTLSATPQPLIVPEMPNRYVVETILLVAIIIIALTATVTLKRKFQAIEGYT
jgi:hypothetical protein